MKKILPQEEIDLLKTEQLICLTGKMGAGKNHVCSILEKYGAISVDFDTLVHKAIELSKNEILQSFGEIARQSGIELLKDDGTINRKNLGKIVFKDSKLLMAQEKIVYPKVTQLVKEIIGENRGKTVLLNATVLYKIPEIMNLCQKIYFVSANMLKRACRVYKRDHHSINQIFRRFYSQKNLQKEYKKTGIKIMFIKN